MALLGNKKVLIYLNKVASCKYVTSAVLHYIHPSTKPILFFLFNVYLLYSKFRLIIILEREKGACKLP